MPLTAEKDHPHVFWSVPKGWFPGSVYFKQDEVPELLRQLRRVPDGRSRAKLLGLLFERLPHSSPDRTASSAKQVVVPRAASPDEERHLPAVEDSANHRKALHMRYLTAGRVDEGRRHASVHRVLLGPPARFIATCHRDGKLKTFRVDSILDAALDPREPYRPADDVAVETYVRESVDGFHDEGPPATSSFVVRNPDARWVKNNLPDGMQAEPIPDGIRVTRSYLRAAPCRPVRRLPGARRRRKHRRSRQEVAILARGALDALPRQVNRRAARPNRPTVSAKHGEHRGSERSTRSPPRKESSHECIPAPTCPANENASPVRLELTVSDPEVAHELSQRVEGRERDDYARRRAAPRRARAPPRERRLDAQTLHREGERLLELGAPAAA